MSRMKRVPSSPAATSSSRCPGRLTLPALAHGRGQARNAGGDLLLAAPQRRVPQVLALSWDADGSGINVSAAEAAR